MLRAAYIGISFDPDRLSTEMGLVSGVGWEPHFNKRDYEGDWSGIALRSNSPHQRYSLYIDGGDRPFRDTEVLGHMPYFQQCIGNLPFDVRSARILKLAPGAIIRQHRDVGISIDHDEARFHVPIVTNDATEFAVADLPLAFSPGECWYINVDLPHRIVNRGVCDRIHLVVDAVVTPELRDTVRGATRQY